MKIKKYISIMFLALTASYTFTACSDDDSLGEAPRLFRPVTSLEVKNNNLVATWENIKGATDYVLELYRVTGTDDQDNNTYELLSEVSCQTSPYTFEGLNWDEKYMVKIKCKGIGKESEQYQTLDANIAYISRLSGTKAIDNAVRISWKEASGSNADIIKAIKVVTETTAPDAATRAEGEDGSETTARIELVSEAELNAGYKDIFNLSPETKYTFYAYKDDEILDNSTYAGKLSTTTATPVNFGESFPAGYIDLRNEDHDSQKILKDPEFWNKLTEGMGVILKGETDYVVDTNNSELTKSITFMTGPTLGGNARILASSNMRCPQNTNIEKVQFINIDFYGDKALTTENEIVKVNPNFIKDLSSISISSGGQIICLDKKNSSIKELIFKGCYIEGGRGTIRTKEETAAIVNATFDGCTINGVGNQGVVTTDNKASAWEKITFKDCTITNIVMLCDMRKTAGDITFNIENCTFCYAPLETTANANTPLFRFNGNEKVVTLNISKTIFGPSLATTGSAGTNRLAYTAGVKGSIFVNPNNNLNAGVSHSYKTNFIWCEDSKGKTYPLDGLLPLDFDEKSLWQDPENGDFKVIGVIGEDGIGASKWLQ
jgi:hypothetical protein